MGAFGVNNKNARSVLLREHCKVHTKRQDCSIDSVCSIPVHTVTYRWPNSLSCRAVGQKENVIECC